MGTAGHRRLRERRRGGEREVGDDGVRRGGDPGPKEAPGYAEAHGIARAHGSFEELLASDDVDAVFVALHPVDHVEWTVKALRAGKHVLCEKPLALSVEDTERVFDAAEAAGRTVVEG
ncbi:Gfo/Idh/MocA family oxidoreductase [Streptomyces sp. M19]